MKCTHGAAVGQLDEEALFYLQARGLTLREARDMLLHAFAGEVLEGIDDRGAEAAARARVLHAARYATWLTTMNATSAARSAEGRSRNRPKAAEAFDVAKIRADFPILSELVHGKPLVYLDSANTSQKPAVGDRGDGRLLSPRQRQHPPRDASAERARDGGCTKARARRRRASSTPPTRTPIVLTKGTTDGINLVAQSYGRIGAEARRRDPAVVARASLEHRAVAAGVRADRRDAARWSPINDRGEIDLDAYAALLSTAHEDRRGRATSRTRSARSIRSSAMIAQAHARGAVVLDRRRAGGAAPGRSTCRRSTATSTCFSSHKMFGPTGTGVLYGRQALLEAMPPYQGGGDMIASVTFEKTLYNAGALQVRGGHAEHRRRRRASARPSTT